MPGTANQGRGGPPDRTGRLIELARAGRTAREIGRLLGTTRDAVRAKARTIGVRLEPTRAWPGDADRTIRGLIAEGATRSEAAAELGVSEAKLKKRLRQIGA